MRSFRALGFLALAACSADVFVGPDGAVPSDGGGGSDGGATSEGGGVTDGSTSGPEVQCGKSVCNGQICCGELDWTTATCASSGTGCQDTLACDDRADCPPNQVCCGLQGSNASGTSQKITHAGCAFGCGVAGSVQLCTTDQECGSGSCKDYVGLPNGLKTCQ